MRIQRTAIIAQVGIDHRKVEINNEILVVIGCRMLADIQVAIKSLKLISGIDVVIVVQHRQSEALAETTRADKEKELVGLFHFLNKPCLIDIVAVVLANSYEVHHTIRYSLSLFFYILFFHN